MGPSSLPVMRDPKFAYSSSLAIAALMGAVSVAGLLGWRTLYPASQAANTVGTDAFSLLIVVPVLLSSLWLARRGLLIGLLLWPGALFYALYIYAFDVICLPPGLLFLPHIVLVVLSAYALIGLVASIDSAAVKRQLAGAVPARVTGFVLVALALLFIALDVAMMAPSLAGHAAVDPLKQAAWIVDLAVECPLLLLGGFLLWRRAPGGYAAGTGLLFQVSALFAGVPFAAIAGAVLTGSPVDASTVVILIFAVFPAALLALFRGAAARVPAGMGDRP